MNNINKKQKLQFGWLNASTLTMYNGLNTHARVPVTLPQDFGIISALN